MAGSIAYGLTFWLLAAAAQTYAVHYDVHRFANCPAASLYALANPVVGRYQYRLAGHLVDARVERIGQSSFRGEAAVRFFFEPRDSALVLPSWSWPAMTDLERRAFNDFIARLRVHELGHRTIAERAVQNRSGSITVLAKSQVAGARALHAMLSTQLHELSTELLRKEQLYDRLTDHGMRQEDAALYGLPAGRDVVFSCP